MVAEYRQIDFEQLLKLRTVVARFGELDVAQWWNSKGQLGRLGAAVLRRGFSRTYRFAQARSVFAIATQKCDEVFSSPGCVTLWSSKYVGSAGLIKQVTGMHSSAGLRPLAA